MAQALVVIGEILGSMYIMRPMLLASAAYLRVRTHLRRPLAIIMAARSVPALRKKLARALSSSPAVPPVSKALSAERIRSDCLVQKLLEVTTLPSGLRVATESTPGHFVAVGLYTNAGSRYETAETLGSSHLLDRLSFAVCLFLLVSRTSLRSGNRVQVIEQQVSEAPPI